MPPPSSDEAFTMTLNAAEEYMALQQALAAALRSGFLSLAQARYSMGAERVSVLQLPSHMSATTRLRVSEDGELELATTEPEPGQAAAHASESSSGGGSGGAGATPLSAEAANTTAALPSAAGEGVEEQLQRLRIAAREGDGLMEQLAAKYGCSSSGSGGNSADGSGAIAAGGPSPKDDNDDDFVEVAKPGRPLHWFGSLVAPSLRDAEGHFGEGLALAVQAANAQRRLRQSMESHKAAPAAAAAAAAVAAAAEGPVYI